MTTNGTPIDYPLRHQLRELLDSLDVLDEPHSTDTLIAARLRALQLRRDLRESLIRHDVHDLRLHLSGQTEQQLYGSAIDITDNDDDRLVSARLVRELLVLLADLLMVWTIAGRIDPAAATVSPPAQSAALVARWAQRAGALALGIRRHDVDGPDLPAADPGAPPPTSLSQWWLADVLRATGRPGSADVGELAGEIAHRVVQVVNHHTGPGLYCPTCTGHLQPCRTRRQLAGVSEAPARPHPVDGP